MLAQVERALVPFRSALEADGYVLQVVQIEGEKLSLRIEAQPHACPDCLVPADVLKTMVLNALKNAAPTIRSVDLQMPA